MLNNALNNYSQTYDEYQRILNFEQVNTNWEMMIWKKYYRELDGIACKEKFYVNCDPSHKDKNVDAGDLLKTRLSYMWYNAFSLNPFGYHILLTTKLEISNYCEIDLGHGFIIQNNSKYLQEIKLGNIFILLHISCTEYFVIWLEKQRNASM